MSVFQCFLIIGNKSSQLAEIQKITDKLKLNINKPSVDLLVIEPEAGLTLAKEKHISIDQIRRLKQNLYHKPIHLPLKVIIIKKAQRLTQEAQNALLKILEEPPRHAIIIMLSSDKKSLLETIISRVITIQAKQDIEKCASKQISLLTKNELELLEETASIDNPNDWLDSEMLALHQALVSNIKSGNLTDLNRQTSIIERCAYTKKLIEANVNAKFAIYDLVFSTSKI
ncbi:hypothetical protein A3D81_00265 [Candidatus Curtissbacteria bacterium RIFCSPHIGHO2_02_FULL_40_17]|uniref:DNA polymerase III subunit delta n=4 Tax=Candidatus Curtissiibacteriota TaxID=1752717 RepID=A0A1F5GGN3_9BACT|nr:MAG: hypothetical protein A2693_00360 [Candidatus Curtissbacteria bacterium RIFCSPHIGHO2_01_FULL_40_12]OGD91010.1 MAG: hypothetical protein A3D81_00265 [Candidatus Curtissbacteria bacterium RIFCSPHIGHO2_02_FULL_40_17]OGE05633.1 MAG: hypothetical protein A3F45_02325 [Candidatus Curtissbacteria bacterium RIFCSPHIGHO2_12_FULL_41_17]OGE08475.1 MAG: hypothetical protein A3I53_00065 [Candidatus Curtissbacteria bacterium RIFCSPLOWO2_02_FULL_40_13b]